MNVGKETYWEILLVEKLLKLENIPIWLYLDISKVIRLVTGVEDHLSISGMYLQRRIVMKVDIQGMYKTLLLGTE